MKENKKEVKIEIMAVGTELLTPYFQDSNSLYLTKRLNDLGKDVSFKTIVGDDWDDLVLAFREALSRADLIITIGGLGPTQDDRTREAVASVLQRKLIFKQEILKKIEERFNRRGLSMPSVNKKQSYIIDGAEILENKNGTAPGLWLDMGSKTVILLPGPPQEIKPMFETLVWPRLKKFQTGFTSRKELKIAGLTESEIETLISDIYPKTSQFKLTTLAYPGQIEIHLTSYSTESQDHAERKMHRLEKIILMQLKDKVFSVTGEELEEVIGKLLNINKKTLAVAESCTGGLLANRITNVAGSSNYFLQGVIVYSNEAKTQLLGVPPSIIEINGAVSSEVARAMSLGIRERSHADYGLAVTGIAGPSGGTPDKPVGLVYTALAWEGGDEVVKNQFLGNRDTIKFQSSQKVLDMLRKHLVKLKLKAPMS